MCESIEVCELVTSFVIEGILVKFVGLDWIPANILSSEVHAVSWVPEELDEEVIAGLHSPLVSQVLKIIPG